MNPLLELFDVSPAYENYKPNFKIINVSFNKLISRNIPISKSLLNKYFHNISFICFVPLQLDKVKNNIIGMHKDLLYSYYHSITKQIIMYNKFVTICDDTRNKLLSIHSYFELYQQFCININNITKYDKMINKYKLYNK